MRSLFFTAVPLALLAAVSLALVSGCGQLYADKVLSVGPQELTVARGPDETPKTHQLAPDAEVILDGKPAELEDIRPGDSVKVTTAKQGEEEVAVKIEATRSEEEGAATQPAGPDELILPPLGLPEQPAGEQSLAPPEAEPEPLAGEDEPAAEPRSEAAAEEASEAADSGEAAPALEEDGQAASPEEEEQAGILFSGVITFLDPQWIRVQGRSGSPGFAEEMTFKLTDETEVTVSGEPADQENLVVGMAVTVTAERDGEEAVAKRIAATPMPV